jgi:GTPase SAR1 family protein
MRDYYLRIGDGFLVCFSFIDTTSYEDVPLYIEQIKRVKDEDNFPILIVGCKSDLIKERVISSQDVIKFSNDNCLPFIETSAKENLKVDNCFLEIVKEIDKFRKINESNKNNKNNKNNFAKQKGNCIIS